MKCRAKKEMKDAKSIAMKNGKPATQGVCVVNQRNGTLFEPNTLAWSGGINKFPEALVVVSATVDC